MKKVFNNYIEFSIFLNFLAFFAFRDIRFFFWISQGLFIISTILYCKGRKIPFQFMFYCIIYILWILLSFLWADSTNYALKFLKENGQVLVVCSCLSVYCTDYEKVKKTIDLMLLSLVFTVIYLLIKTPLIEWKNIYYFDGTVSSDAGRLGYTIGIHPNHMGALCAIAILLFFYYIRREESNKIFGVIMLIIYFVLLLFTKSRGSILFAFAMLSTYWITEQERKITMIIKFMSIIVFGLIIFWAIFNIEPLYNIVGFRFEGFSGIFNSNTKTDLSYQGRKLLINAGVRMIKDHPFLGVGAGNYAYMAYTKYGIWREVYSHNNFIEIFANLGLVGFLIYYLPRIWCFIKLHKKFKTVQTEYRLLLSVLFSYSLMSVLFDYIKISYSNEEAQLLFVICFSVALFKDNIKKITIK